MSLRDGYGQVLGVQNILQPGILVFLHPTSAKAESMVARWSIEVQKLAYR